MAVDRIGPSAEIAGEFVHRHLGHAQPDDERGRIVRRSRRRMAAPVLDVAILTGTGVEHRAEAVGGEGRGGRGHPEPLEETVAERELAALGEVQIGLRLAERFRVAAAADAARAALIGLEALGCVEAVRRVR